MLETKLQTKSFKQIGTESKLFNSKQIKGYSNVLHMAGTSDSLLVMHVTEISEQTSH